MPRKNKQKYLSLGAIKKAPEAQQLNICKPELKKDEVKQKV